MSAKPFPGPDVPHRTSRKRALEIGTSPAGFDGDPSLTDGLPSDVAGGTYRDEVTGSPDPGAPSGEKNPFSVG